MSKQAINSLDFNNNQYIFTLPYGVCSTGAGTAAKAVSVDNFSLENGSMVTVKFSTANTAANPTLSVNSTDAKPIYYNGAAIDAKKLQGRTYSFVYDGSYWQLIGDIDTDTNTTKFTITATAEDDDVVILTGTNGSNKVTYKAEHTKKGPANGYTSGNTTTSISGSGGTGTIKIPQLTIDEYGHVTAATDENVTITLPTIPTIPSAIKNPNSLKITGNKVQAISYDGSLETSLDFVEGDNVTIASEAGKITISAEDTHHQSKNVITSTNTSKDDSKGVTNGNVHLNLIENNTVRSSHKIKGSGATTVTVDSAGDIVISSTDNDTKYVHPSYTARIGVPTANQTPKFGGTFQVSQPVSDTLGHITAVNSRTITIPNDLATSEAPGLMPPEGIEKLSATNIAYGTCSTAATTVEKAVTIINNDNWVLTTGSLITVKFAETNTATAPKINVNNTGAYPIWYNNAVYESASSYGGYKDRHITYQFNGTHWVFISWSYDTNSDTKVQQDAAITTNGEYPVILAYSTSTSKVTNTVKKTSTLKYNPSTQILTAPTFKGNLIGNVTGNADTATSAGKLGNISVGDEAQPIYFKNGLPVASTSDVGSSLVPIRLKDGTLTECSGIEDTFIQWSNSSISGGLSPVDAAISNLHSANRFSFAKAAGITIEYSRDGGATYTAYPNKTNEDKIQLVSGIGETFYIGAHNTDVTINDKLRVTLNATNMGVYTKLRKLLLQITTQGASGCTVTVETATKGAIDTFTKIADYNIDGWSGWNSIPMGGIAFGGGTGQTSNIGAIRLTFNITGVSSSYSSALTLMDIVAIGETYWSFPSTMAKTGHLYSYDAAQNATFPGEITATKFNGPATTINTILPLSLGGTGKALTFTPNAIIRFSSTSNANYFSSTPTASGAFYCTSANGSAVFGTLPIAQGGTGATTAANALKNLGVNATATQLNQLATYSFTTTTPSNTSTDTTVPTSKAVYSAIANSFAANDAMRFKGVLNAASDLPATCQIGDTYKVATAGKYAGVKCEIGDIIIAVKNATTENNSNWTVVQANIDGTVILSSTSGDVGSDNQPVYIKGRVATASKYTDWVHAVTSSNTNGCITVKTNDTTDSNVMVYAHPEDYGAKSGGPTGNQTPGFGSTFTIHQMTSDKYGHVTDVTNRTVKIPNTAATQSAAGLMSAADKTKLDGIETGANKYVHPNYTARTGKPTENLIPNFGDVITISQITSDTLGHVTGATDRTITIPSTLATETVNGLMPLGDKAKLNRTNLGYGTCSTAAATAEKVVIMPSAGNTKWVLVPGSQIQVNFSNTNTADSPTLNVNGTGAKAIDFNTKLNYLIANVIYTFIYDGTNYVLLDENHRIDGLGGNYAEIFNDSENSATGNYSHAEGIKTKANGNASHAEGQYTNATGEAAHVEGADSGASGYAAHAEGSSNAEGDYSHSEGMASMAQGLASHAEGKDSNAEGEASHAEGGAVAIGDYSHAEGGSVAMGNYSHSEGQASSAYGDYSHAEGNSTIANEEASHAEGNETAANGENTHAEGYKSQANGKNSHAEGEETETHGYAAHSEGYKTNADADYTHAEGEETHAFGKGSHTQGYKTYAEGIYSHAEGYENKAIGKASHAEGGNLTEDGIDIYPEVPIYINENDAIEISSTTAMGILSHAEGSQTLAHGYSSHSEGRMTSASGNSSHAEGYNTLAKGNNSHTEGNFAFAGGSSSHAEGTWTTAEGESSHAEGVKTLAHGYGSHAEGGNMSSEGIAYPDVDMCINPYDDEDTYTISSTTALGTHAHAEGIMTLAYGDSSHSEGDFTVACGESAHAEGYGTLAYGHNSHAEGYSTEANGEASHTEGNETTANGNYSHAEGNASSAEGIASHAEGIGTIANGNGSHAEGQRTIAQGNFSHAEGMRVEAIGNYSHAEGSGTIANGIGSHAQNFGTIADGLYQTALGQYNIGDTTSALIIGNGTTGAARSNMLTMDWSGNTIITGAVTAPTFIGNLTGTATNSTNAVNATNASKVYVNNTTANNTYYIVGALGQTAGNADIYRAYNASGTANTAGIYFNGSTGVLYGAAWNDYAEYRETKTEIEAGRVVCETGKGDLILSTERLQPGAEIVSDTFGFAIGETDRCKTPIAASGRVLAYPYEDRNSYQAGDAVCAAPNGTVSKMTDEEICKYPHRIIGTVSEIPEYETWGQTDTPVNGRIWIRIK